jgi:outer membrane protein assembly factor BamB
MMSFMRCLVLSVICVSVATAAQKEAVQTQPVGQLAPSETLSAAGIQVVWQQRLPVKSAEKLESLNAMGAGLYVLTTTNYLFGLNASDGAQLFADAVAPYGLRLLPLIRRDKTIMVMTGSSLKKLDMVNGSEVDRLMVPFGVVAVPAANSTFYYLAADDGRIYAYDISDRVRAFKAAADAGSLVTNVAATDAYVIFTTDKGAVVAMEPGRPVKKWRYDTSGAIRGRITIDANDAYVSSADTNVYKFDALTGKILWNYMAGARLEDGPQVTASAVYQFAGENGVYALDKKTGKVLWQEKDGRGLLTEKGGKSYLMGRDQSIIVVDNATGKRLFEVSMPGADEYAGNVPGGAMYVGSSTTGRVACLKAKD